MTAWATMSCLGLLLLVAAASERSKYETFYVSPTGNDRWTGRLARPSADRSDGPFRTIERARNAIRDLKARGGLKRPVRVLIREGTYYLNRPLVFTPEDSGTEECPVVYAAYRGERPVISGGRPITAWRQCEVNGTRAWVAELPRVKAGKWYFRQLWVDGERRFRPRLPKRKWYFFAGLLDIDHRTPWQRGQKRALFEPGHIRNWRNLSDVEVVFLTLWRESHLPIARVDEQKHIVTFAKASQTRLTEDFSMKPGRYYVDNVFEALQEPGEWYLDRGEGLLYYIPKRGERPNEAEVVAPRLTQLLRIVGAGDGKEAVEHIRFRGLTFSHTDWQLPENQAGAAQAAVNVPGAVYLRGARRCSFTDCTFAHLGNYAVEFDRGCTDNRLSRCSIHDLGAGGVKIGHRTQGTTVVDCEICDGGHVYHSAVGVWIGDSGHNRIAYNHIHHFYYTGVSVGWTWGYGRSNATHNLIEYNHIHHIGQGLLSDMGGIYTLGVSPGTRLRFNLIHDVESYSYGGWGIYPDEGSSHIVIENNVVYRTKTGGFHQHYGRENVVQNNIFAYARQGQIQRTRIEDHTSFIFRRNIVYWTTGPLLHGNWKQIRAVFDYNLYWREGGKPFDFAGRSLEEWRAEGQDQHSIVADPKFRAPREGDFSLSPSSPANRIGFKPIDLSRIGPRRRRQRKEGM